MPLKQLIFEDSNSPEYQKFKVYRLPKILKFEKVDYILLLSGLGLMSIFGTQKVKLFYAALLAINSH